MRQNIQNSRTQRAAAARCCQSVRGGGTTLSTRGGQLRRRGARARRRLERTGGRMRARGLGNTTAATTAGVTRDINSLFKDGGIGALRERGATLCQRITARRRAVRVLRGHVRAVRARRGHRLLRVRRGRHGRVTRGDIERGSRMSNLGHVVRGLYT